jgi:hypothetical protein
MNLELLKENDDGSADYSISLTNEEKEQLILFAFIEILKRGIKEGKQYVPSESGMGDTTSGGASCSYGPCVKSGKPEQPCICAETSEIPY